VHRASLSQGQEAFLEGHVGALARLGGVPAGMIRYDNLKPAVSRMLFGRSRVESDRWVAFRSHYAGVAESSLELASASFSCFCSSGGVRAGPI